MELPSKHIADAVSQLSSLPGVGKRTALRLALHLLKQNKEDVISFSQAFIKMREEVQFCESCNNISDSDICSICSSTKRDHSTVCVVEDMRDVIAVENTHQYHGIYHVLGGVISPIDGVGPSDLHIEPLVDKAKQGEIKEVILALSTTMEGDTTNFYLFKKLKPYNVNLTTIAKGVAVGGELEYTDEATLGSSIANRMPYEYSLTNRN